MITINKEIQSEIVFMPMEDMVPKDSIFRKIDKYIDFTFIYDLIIDKYSIDNGRPSIDPVVLFKMVFIQAIDGIKSMRQTCNKIRSDAEYRWFLGIPFGKSTPHFSTFSKNYERRFKNSTLFEDIFTNIVNQAIKYHLVDGTTFYTDSTHKKANANKNKYTDEIVKEVKKRRIDLENEINEERIKNGEKPFDYKDEIKEKHIKVSKTDKESGYYHRDNKEKGFMYLDHRTVDHKCNIIVDCYMTPGNVHDSTPYIFRMEHIKKKFDFKIKQCAIDSGYDILEIRKYFHDNNIFGVIGYRRYGTKESRKERSKYEYNKELDVYVERETGEILEYTKHVNKLGYKLYSNIDKSKKKLRHINEELKEEMRRNRLSEEGKKLYSNRCQKIERSFADSKNNHGYRYAMYKGLEKNQNYTWLICAAQNIKIIAIRKSKTEEKGTKISKIHENIINFFKTSKNFIKNLCITKPLEKNLGVCLRSEIKLY